MNCIDENESDDVDRIVAVVVQSLEHAQEQPTAAFGRFQLLQIAFSIGASLLVVSTARTARKKVDLD